MSAIITIPGHPVPKQRIRRARHGGVYTPTATRCYEQTVAWSAMCAGFEPSPEAIYRVDLQVMSCSARADLDNIAKSVLDGLNQLEGFDDRRVRELRVRFRLVTDPAKECVIARVDELREE